MSENNQHEVWSQKLVGKKYVENEVSASEQRDQTFTKHDLPEEHRVLKPNSFVTLDYRENRLNVHLDDDNVCTRVQFG
ncbi:uncharacterized protein VTP21DRAFT_23 [Calcarisporiella thermophila]|uniref:uncharacterized protein n=1 Tax=Calcarisporiella thermophila TaxID=911321 RepID=UPI0037448D49